METKNCDCKERPQLIYIDAFSGKRVDECRKCGHIYTTAVNYGHEENKENEKEINFLSGYVLTNEVSGDNR